MEPLQWTLSCLLYLNSITSPNTYTDCTINALELAHHPQIVMIESSPTLSSFVWEEYNDEAREITINEGECW